MIIKSIKPKKLTLNEIKRFVDVFILFAKDNTHLTFLVTEIGCGLAGLKPKDVALLFKDSVDVANIHLPAKFWHKLIQNKNNSNI